ncbi:cardiolipin synthase [Neobacillus ginsengisoli]|uniref:Cardiolipin synthase n=1 Tax=Neobacillus ginsengisoli TaxID=904295 RepID=A0ABT9XZ99_9BACI|nr:cardiolipin synthase [Neobacillus ginsengisoli]MDQ0200902.1 cardiolipin synthase [Neobacillus ginsengisoli]
MNFALIFFGLILLIILWFYIDFTLGRRKHLSLVRKSETPMIHGNFDIFPHGKELFADYFGELRKAKKHIHVLFYIVKTDAFSHEFLHILKEKAAEGIEVRMLLDRIGSYQITKQIVLSLQEAGVRFSFSNTLKFPFLFYSSQVRNHRKISIIDGEIGYLGGFNVGKEYIDEDPKLSPWRDYHLKITGESVTFLQSEFLIDWREYAQEDLLGSSFYFPKLPKGDVRHQFIPTEANHLEASFINLIQKATTSITIGTPYFIPSNRLLQELILAARKGIRISVVVPYTADHMLVQEASFRYLRRLLKEGIQVFQYKNGFYHAKTIVIDDKICDIGTANFDKRSLFLNKEINCLIYDREFIGRLTDVLRRDILDSKPLTLADLSKPNLLRSLKESIAGAVSFFL